MPPMTDPMELVGRATEASDLRDRIMNPNIAKSEAEWWAAREIERLEACICEMVEWRPIETAPRDGTLILCLYPDRHGQGRLSLRYWAVGDWPSSGRTEGWSDQHRQLRKTDPTHWIPLPPAPGAEA